MGRATAQRSGTLNPHFSSYGGFNVPLLRCVPLPTLRSFLKDEKITRAEAKAKFAQAREWDNNVMWGDEGL